MGIMLSGIALITTAYKLLMEPPMRMATSIKPTVGLPPRKVMLETLIRRMGLVRLSIASLALLATACTGLIDEYDGPGDPTPDEREAKRLWLEKAEPVLTANCASCHASLAGQDFLAGTVLDGATEEQKLAVKEKLVSFDPGVVNLVSPKSSRLIQKGLHDGPEMTATQISDVLEWMLAEQDATPQPGEPGGGTVLKTEPITVMKCPSGTLLANCPINEALIPGVEGAKITFKAPDINGMLYVNELTLVGGVGGAYIEHPLFVSVPVAGTEGGTEVADGIDRYFNTKLNLKAAETGVIEGGTASFLNFPNENQLEIHFKVVSAYKMEEGTGTGTGTTAGGCKDLPSFKTNAQPLFNASCASCHLAGNAKMAMDLAGINTTDDAMLAVTCGQIKTRVNLTTPDTSGVFIAPDPANGNHPFKFNAAQLTTFKNGVLVWINAEKVAP